MDRKEPIQSKGARHARSWWSACRVCAVLILLFAVIFAGSWWFTPIKRFATLKFDDGCALFVFSPDSTLLVTAGKRDYSKAFGQFGPLRVWDVERKQERFSFAHKWKAITTVQVSPDSGLLAAHQMEGDLKLWNTKTGEEVACLPPGTKFTKGVDFRFSPDGRFLAYQDRNVNYINFWNIQSKKEQGSVESNFHTLAIAPDGKSFATLRRNDIDQVSEVLLWKMAQVPVLAKQHRLSASKVAFSHDLQTFAAADDLPDGNGLVTLWDMVTGDKLWSLTFNEYATHLQSLSFVANGKILAAHGGKGTQLDWHLRTTLWNVTSTPKEIGSFSETPAVSPDGEWLAIPLDKGVKLVKASVPERGADLIVNGDLGPSEIWTLDHKKSWASPSFSPDSKWILVGAYRNSYSQEPLLGNWLPEKYNPFRADPNKSVFRAWDTGSCRELLTLAKYREPTFSPDGQVLASFRDNKTIDLWKVPFRASLWHAAGRAVIVWVALVSICWLEARLWKRGISRHCWWNRAFTSKL
jgi:WD40 repeat protein